MTDSCKQPQIDDAKARKTLRKFGIISQLSLLLLLPASLIYGGVEMEVITAWLALCVGNIILTGSIFVTINRAVNLTHVTMLNLLVVPQIILGVPTMLVIDFPTEILDTISWIGVFAHPVMQVVAARYAAKLVKQAAVSTPDNA